jgi:hypothetical protein
MLNVVPTYFPQFGFSAEMSAMIQEFLKMVGIMLPWGVAHKGVKLMAK